MPGSLRRFGVSDRCYSCFKTSGEAQPALDGLGVAAGLLAVARRPPESLFLLPIRSGPVPH